MGFPDGRIEVAAEVAAWADDRIGGTRFTTLLDAFTTFVAGDLGRTLEHLLLIVEDDEAPAGVADEADQFLMMVAPMAGASTRSAAQRRRSEQPDAEFSAMPALMGTSARVSLLMYDGQFSEALAQDTFGVRSGVQRRSTTASWPPPHSADAVVHPRRRRRRHHLARPQPGTGGPTRALVNGVLAAAPLRATRTGCGRSWRSPTSNGTSHPRSCCSSTTTTSPHASPGWATPTGRGHDPPVADQAQAIGYHWLHVLARASLVRLGWADARDADSARQTLERVDAPLIQLVAELVVAAGTHDQAGLDRVADRFAAVEAGLFEVDARVAALDLVAASAPEPRGQDPDPHDRAGRQERLEKLLAACPGLRARPAADDDASPVLSRELEIATLAARASQKAGRRAARPVAPKSTTTCGAPAKLGIEGRHQLAAALSR
jgi:hypothetical protein